jgi:hypothetical protein
MNSYPYAMLLYAVPYVLIDVAGITYAAVEWKKHPRLSTLVIAALGISIVKMGFMNLFYMSAGAREVSALFTVVRAADALVGFGAHALLVFAVFFGFREGQVSAKEKKGEFSPGN